MTPKYLGVTDMLPEPVIYYLTGKGERPGTGYASVKHNNSTKENNR